MSIRWALVLAAFVLMIGGASASSFAEDTGKEPSFIRFGAGYYDINDDQSAAEFHMEYISGSKWWVFNPFVGVMATSDTAFYGYAGIRLDLFMGNRFVITPSFAPGLYHDGDGKDLGYPIEFRSAIEFAYRFDDRARLGLSLYHLSNASLDDNNPGTEVVTLHYSYPLTSLFGD
ncbi:MAG: acyloxyacyl hydrolase [Alphaproteobacteria bacterium]|nr:acyloxyacyl hydrolase [Alphaproteobacteria bacterium]